MAIEGWPRLSGASSAALPQDRWRSMAAWARPGRHAAGLRERDSVGAYLVRAGLALLAWLVPWRAVAALARACRPPRGAGLASLAAMWRCDRLMHLPAGLISIWFWQAAPCMRTE